MCLLGSHWHCQLKEMRKRQNRGLMDCEGPVGKGEKRSFESSSGNESASYADAASKERWRTPSEEKKKKKKQRADEQVGELLGAKESPNRDLFVSMLDYSRCRRPEQLEAMVKKYCKRRDVDINYAKAFVIKSDRNRANCKISVDESAVDTLLADDFWPDPSYARFWYTNNGQQQNRNERTSDDDDESLSD